MSMPWIVQEGKKVFETIFKGPTIVGSALDHADVVPPAVGVAVYAAEVTKNGIQEAVRLTKDMVDFASKK